MVTTPKAGRRAPNSNQQSVDNLVEKPNGDSTPESQRPSPQALVTGNRKKLVDKRSSSCQKEIRKVLSQNLFDDCVYPVDLPEQWDRLNRKSIRLLDGRLKTSALGRLEAAHKLASWACRQPRTSPLSEFMEARHAPVNVLSLVASEFLGTVKRLNRTCIEGFVVTEEKLRSLEKILRGQLALVPEETKIPEVLAVRHFILAILCVLSQSPWWVCDPTIQLDGFGFPPDEKGPDRIHFYPLSPPTELSKTLVVPSHISNTANGGRDE